MKTPLLIMATAAVATFAAAPEAKAGSTFFFSANQSYLSSSDSPIPFSGGVQLENFEDGLLNVAGVIAKQGKIKSSGSKTDSVDADSGPIDGKGKSGNSYTSGSSKKIIFKFSNNGQGMPSMAGLVWTDGKKNSTVTFKAWNAAGELIGKIKKTLGDSSRKGTTAEDRFFGLVSTEGISKIQISSNYAGFEIDHLQFAYGLSVVPVPAPVALGTVGLIGAAVWRRRMMRRDAN